MSKKFKRVWIGKSHLFKKVFSKLSLQFIMSQKYVDKLYSKCCKIFKVCLTCRKLCFDSSAKLLLLILLSAVTYIFITQIVYWFTKSIKACLYVIEIRVSYCATELEWIWFLWIGIWNLYYVKTETLSQVFSYNFCEFLHNDSFWGFFSNYFTNLWMPASRFFVVEPAFCERDKNHKFDNFKAHKNLLFNEVVFYFIWLLHCIKSVWISLYSVWMRENTDTFYAVLYYKRC